MVRDKENRLATCHPNRPNHCKGLCHKCYDKQRYENRRIREGIVERKGILIDTCPEHPEINRTASEFCRKCYAKKYESENKNRLTEYRKNWTAENREKINEKALIRKRQRDFGASPEQIKVLQIVQNNLCAICKTFDNKTLHLDHCHDTGKIRGLLCQKCNQALGLFRDDPDLLRNAAAYLEQHRKKNDNV